LHPAWWFDLDTGAISELLLGDVVVVLAETSTSARHPHVPSLWLPRLVGE